MKLALATAFHRSAQPSGLVVDEPDEEEVHETRDAPRGLETHLPGEQPGILAEPPGQRSDRSLRRSSLVGSTS